MDRKKIRETVSQKGRTERDRQRKIDRDSILFSIAENCACGCTITKVQIQIHALAQIIRTLYFSG